VGLATVLCTGLAASAQTLPVSGDSFVSPGSETNYSTSPTINVGGAGGYHGLIAFDLSALPAGVTSAFVSKASITLFVNKLGSAGNIDVCAENGPWTESLVSGTNAPSPGMVVASQLLVTAASTYITVDATALAKAWIDGTTVNSGIFIAADPGSPSTSVLFDSKESSSTSHPAVLQVTLVGTGAAGPAGPAGPQGPAGASAQYFRTTFSYQFPVPVSSSTPNPPLDVVVLASLFFYPSASGTAVVSARGTCQTFWVESAPDMLYLVPAASATAAAQEMNNRSGNVAVLYEEPLVASQYRYMPFSTENTLQVLANRLTFATLYGAKNGNYDNGSQDKCTGSSSVTI